MTPAARDAATVVAGGTGTGSGALAVPVTAVPVPAPPCATPPRAVRARPVRRLRGTAMLEPDIETMSREALAALQLQRLRATLRAACSGVGWHRDRLRAAGLRPEALRSLADLQRLPLMTKDDLRAHYPFGLFARPLPELMRLHASSGTTGQATLVGYTPADVANWAALMARSMACAGVRRGDLVHNAYGYGLFTGGLGMHYGAERLGAAVVPVAAGATERQVALIRDLRARVLCATPSYALAIAEAATGLGVDLRGGSLRIGLFGGEPWSEAMRGEIEARLGLRASDVYGLSELMGPGVAIECQERAGLHGWEDHFLFEIVDPETGRVLPEGAVGELVVTTLTKQALPMIRYRTRDITRLATSRCGCGRSHLRLQRVTGRSDDMLIVRGVNLYPSQVEAALVGQPGLAPHYRLLIERDRTLDRLTVEVELADPPGATPAGTHRARADALAALLKSALGLTAAVVLRAPGEIPRSTGKAVRVIDLRATPGGGADSPAMPPPIPPSGEPR